MAQLEKAKMMRTIRSIDFEDACEEVNKLDQSSNQESEVLEKLQSENKSCPKKEAKPVTNKMKERE